MHTRNPQRLSSDANPQERAHARNHPPWIAPVLQIEPRPFADPDTAARKLIEIANAVEAVKDDRIFIERVNEPFLASGGNGEQFKAGSRGHYSWQAVAAREAGHI